MNPEYIAAPTAPGAGEEKVKRASKGKSNKTDGISLEWTFGPNKRLALVGPKKRASSVGPAPRIPFEDIPPVQPVERPHTFPPQIQDPIIHQDPPIGTGTTYNLQEIRPPGPQGPGAGVPALQPQPQFQPQPQPRPQPQPPHPHIPSNPRAMPYRPAPRPDQIEIIPQPWTERVHVKTVRPKELSSPIVIMPRQNSTNRREHRRRSPSPPPRTPRHPIRPREPTDGGAVSLETIRLSEMVQRLQRALKAAEDETERAVRAAVQQQRLRQLSEREADLRVQLANIEQRETAHQAFIAEQQTRLIRDAERPVTINQSLRSRSHVRRLDEQRKHWDDETRNPPRTPTRLPRVYHDDRYPRPEGGRRRRTSVSHERTDRPSRERTEEARGPPVAGGTGRWDRVREREEELHRRERNERPGRDDDWREPI